MKMAMLPPSTSRIKRPRKKLQVNNALACHTSSLPAVSESYAFDNTADQDSCRRSKRFRSKVLNFWDFERICNIATSEGDLTVVTRDVPGEGTVVLQDNDVSNINLVPKEINSQAVQRKNDTVFYTPVLKDTTVSLNIKAKDSTKQSYNNAIKVNDYHSKAESEKCDVDKIDCLSSNILSQSYKVNKKHFLGVMSVESATTVSEMCNKDNIPGSELVTTNDTLPKHKKRSVSDSDATISIASTVHDTIALHKDSSKNQYSDENKLPVSLALNSSLKKTTMNKSKSDGMLKNTINYKKKLRPQKSSNNKRTLKLTLGATTTTQQNNKDDMAVAGHENVNEISAMEPYPKGQESVNLKNIDNNYSIEKVNLEDERESTQSSQGEAMEPYANYQESVNLKNIDNNSSIEKASIEDERESTQSSQEDAGYYSTGNEDHYLVASGESLQFNEIRPTNAADNCTGEYFMAKGLAKDGLATYFLCLNKGYIAFETTALTIVVGMTGRGSIKLITEGDRSVLVKIIQNTELRVDKGTRVVMSIDEDCPSICICFLLMT